MTVTFMILGVKKTSYYTIGLKKNERTEQLNRYARFDQAKSAQPLKSQLKAQKTEKTNKQKKGK